MNRIAGFTLVFSLVFPGLRLTSPGWLRAAVLTPMFLVLIQGGNCEAQAEVDSNSVVCVSSSGSVTTKALVGATLEDHMRLYTSRYAFDNFEKLLKQTETARRMGQFSGTNLASLTASITRHLASLYDRKVNGEIALRLVEEFVLHRDPAPVWYYDQKTIRDCLDYNSHLWADKARLWQAAADGLPVEEFKRRMTAAFQSHPPIGDDEQQISRAVKLEVDEMVRIRDEGGLISWAAFQPWRNPRIRVPTDREAYVKSHWLQAELYNWWTHCLVKRLGYRPIGDELERIFRPGISRYLIVGRIEHEGDRQVVERLVESLRYAPDAGLNWQVYREALGFGAEFGMTNRHLVSLIVTNGALGQLIGTKVVLPKIEVRLPDGPVPGRNSDEMFLPRTVDAEIKAKAGWTAVELTDEGRLWVATRRGMLHSDSKHLRAWVSVERFREHDRWDWNSANAIKTQTITRIVTDDLKPALEKFIVEFTYRNSRWFPTVDQLVAILKEPKYIHYVCESDTRAVRMLQEPIPR